MGDQPSDPGWWRERIERESKTRRTRYLPYSGKLVVGVSSLITLPIITYVAAGQVGVQQYSRIAGTIAMLFGLAGVNFRFLFSLLNDPYYTRFYHTTIHLIDKHISENKTELKAIAAEHLEPLTDVEDEEQAIEALEKCVEELAEHCSPD